MSGQLSSVIKQSFSINERQLLETIVSTIVCVNVKAVMPYWNDGSIICVANCLLASKCYCWINVCKLCLHHRLGMNTGCDVMLCANVSFAFISNYDVLS